MKDFLKSKKGITIMFVLAIVIIVLTLLVAKCSNGSEGSKAEKEVTKTEQEKNKDKEDDKSKNNSSNREVEDTSNAGLTSVGGEVGAGNTEDVTEFPNDIDSDETVSSSGDSQTGSEAPEENKETF